jgi:hypothetical protein
MMAKVGLFAALRIAILRPSCLESDYEELSWVHIAASANLCGMP